MIIKIDKKIKNTFRAANIFFSPRGDDDRLKIGTTLDLQENFQLEPYCSINTGNIIASMGSFSYSNSNLPRKNFKVGRYCSIASGLTLQGVNHPIERFTTSSLTYDSNFHVFGKALADNPESSFKMTPNTVNAGKHITIIHNDVWIGGHVTLSPGVQIGNGAIVGSNSLVTKDVPPYAIVGGVPAKIIRYRFTAEIIEKLLDLQWWDYAFWDFNEFNVSDNVEKFCDFLQTKIALNNISKYKPNTLTVKNLYEDSEFYLDIINGNYFNITDKDIFTDYHCDLCRDEAINIENSNIEASYHLMQLSSRFRPEGQFIRAKIKQYQNKLNII